MKNALLQGVIEHMAEGVLLIDAAGLVLWTNPAFLALYGLGPADEVVGSSFERIYRAAWSGETYDRRFQKSLIALTEHQRCGAAPVLQRGDGSQGLGTASSPQHHPQADGSHPAPAARAAKTGSASASQELALPGNRWVRMTELHGDPSDGCRCFMHADITALKRQQQALREAQAQARENEARYRLLAEYSSDVTLALKERKFAYVSPAVARLLGWTPDSLHGKDVLDFCHPDDVSGMLDAMRRLSTSPEATCRTRLLHANGSFTWMEARACLAPQPVDATDAPTMVVNLRSIAARKYIEDDLQNARRKLEELSVSDSLTGLANRRKFDETLDVECRRAQRDGSSACLILIDVDNLNLLNDACSQPVGDGVLRNVAAVLASYAQRAGDLAARCSGDEFALLLPNTDVEQAETIAEKLRAAVALLDPPINFPGFLSVSIGLCSTDHSRLGGSPGQLLNLADEALQCAKRNGKNQVHVLRDLGRRPPGVTAGASRMHH
jgi:diguanylate cyclase (GGDEF)-like protein/PAS domain S-box-containing protein